MESHNLDEFVRTAESLYEERLRAMLEQSHRGDFVAIEPVSGDYFLGRTMSEAGSKAKDAHPDRLTHTMRVGHKAALHFGVQLQ